MSDDYIKTKPEAITVFIAMKDKESPDHASETTIIRDHLEGLRMQISELEGRGDMMFDIACAIRNELNSEFLAEPSSDTPCVNVDVDAPFHRMLENLEDRTRRLNSVMKEVQELMRNELDVLRSVENKSSN